MGLYASTNASSARIIALIPLVVGAALVSSSGRLSGLVLGAAGATLYIGVGTELKHMGLRDILLFIAFWPLLLIGLGMYANGF